MEGIIFDIKHFAVHDGPGIRTTVFLKGCPLKCLWCHNPEGLSKKTQLGFLAHQCTGCGQCVAVCPASAHQIDADGHHYDRRKCIACGKCVQSCHVKALILYGRIVEAEELIPELLSDRDFYDCSQGGVTLSGGECLMQPQFCAQLLRALKKEKVHTAVDTCGFVTMAALDTVLADTDLFLYDIKAYDEAVHIRCTGQSNRQILENLRYLDGQGKKTEIRIPFVPGLNDGQISKIGAFLATLSHVTGVRVLPYHDYAGTKYRSLGMENLCFARPPEEKELADAKKILSSYGLSVLE